MFIEIITPDRKVFSGDADMVEVPGTSGKFQVLNNHAPIISTLSAGNVRVVNDKKDAKTFAISGGVVEVLNNRIIVLAEPSVRLTAV